jgi:eukaryotic-like serine/threonine-protein kinase
MMPTELRDQLQASLGAQYTVEREVGRGGMATVFLARDLKHGRSVALKVLHAELASSLGPERFRREIAFAAQLQHPHILTVLDSGETPEGQLWFTMPYVDGESLRDRLKRERQMSVEESLRIGRETAQALDYAHRHRVIHRDVKPENILLTSDGQALVADFGIGRALNPHTDEHSLAVSHEHSLTGTGMAVGTPTYMSPEQASGERHLDARTDVYSLGVVVYEMLAGEPPFTGLPSQAVIAKMTATEAPSVRRLRPAVPPAVDAAVRKAMSPVPADRFGTASDFARALDAAERTGLLPAAATPDRPVAPTPPRGHRRFPVGFALLGLGFFIGVGVLFAWRSRSAPSTPLGAVRVAVLPFENLGDSSDAYFADGLTDAVRGKLTALPGLAVIASASSSQYKHTTKSPQEIAQELGGVRYLLVGKVRWAKSGGESRVQVSPALVDVTTGTDTWEQPFDAPLTDVFKVQGDIAGRVAQALGVALNAGTRQTLTERPTQNLAAYDAYLKGEDVAPSQTSDPIRLNRATTYFEQAIALDSSFAPAWAKLAQTQATMYFDGAVSPERAELTRKAAERAQLLAPNAPESYIARGYYEAFVLNDNPRALAEFAAGLKIAPSSADLLAASALVEQSLGHWDAALAHLRQAEILDPRNVLTVRRLATTYIWLRRYPEAAAASDRGLTLSPENLSLLEGRIMVSLAQGDLTGAHAAVQSVSSVVDQPALVAFLSNFWDLYWVLDDTQQRLALSLPPAEFGDRAPWGTVLTQLYALRGDRVRSRIYADSARLTYEAVLRQSPQDAQSHAEYGLVLAYLGRKADAIREAEQARTLAPIAQDGYSGPYYQHLAVRTYLQVGEPDKALDLLEPLLKIPYMLSPGWLKIDPNFNSLRTNPRFQALIAAQ